MRTYCFKHACSKRLRAILQPFLWAAFFPPERTGSRFVTKQDAGQTHFTHDTPAQVPNLKLKLILTMQYVFRNYSMKQNETVRARRGVEAAPKRRRRRSDGGARLARTRTRSATSLTASRPQRPPTSLERTQGRCGPGRCSSG